MQVTSSQKDMVDQLGVAARTIAFWADRDVIRPAEKTRGAGSGIHRRFSESEVDIAAILHQVSALKLPIAMLGHVAQFVRRIQRAPNVFKPALRFEDSGIIGKFVAENVEALGAARIGKIVSWY